MHGSESSSDSIATIGQGNLNITNISTNTINRDITKTEINQHSQITSDFDAQLKIDLRLLAAAGNLIIGDTEAASASTKDYWNSVISGAKSSQTLLEKAETIANPIKEIPLLGTAFYHLSPVEQLAHTFVEKGSKLYFTNTQTGEVIEVTKADLTKNYAVNGIQTDLTKIVENYLNKNPELTVRHNPTHGMVGDLIESGLGKLTDLIGLENVIAMNRYVMQDMNERRDLVATIDPVTGDRIVPINLFHSQGTIIGKAAMDLYQKEYGGDAANQINNTQKFVAVGPAVLKEDWGSTVVDLGLKFDPKTDYRHDPLDPVRYLTVPSNTVNQVANLLGKPDYNSRAYIPNLFDPIYGVGLGISDGLNMATGGHLYKAIGKDLPNMEHHDVKNEYYQQPFKLNSQ